MKQSQNSGDNSINLQAESMTLGLSYRDARDIAEDVFNENIVKFAGDAQAAANARAMDLTDSFLGSLRGQGAEALETMKDPDMQRALFYAQQEYACTGDKVLGEVLVEMLVSRASAKERDIKQLALNEALRTAPKLTTPHLSALSLLLLVKRTHLRPRSLEALRGILRTLFVPAAKGLALTESDMAYMEYTGCISIGLGEKGIGSIYSTHYRGVFTAGFLMSDVAEATRDLGPPLIVPCVRDSSRFQIGAIDKEVLEDLIDSHDLSEHAAELRRLMDIGALSHSEVEDDLSSIDPVISDLISLWSKSPLKNSTLTTVGVALGHANLKRVHGADFIHELDIWVN